MRRILLRGLSFLLVALGFAWRLLDVVGRGDTVMSLGHQAQQVAAFVTSRHELGWQVAPWFLMALGALSLFFLQWPDAAHWVKRRIAGSSSVERRGLSPLNATHQPDWTLRELFFRLSPSVTDPASKLWQQVGQEVRDRLSLGTLESWGRAIRSDRRRLALAPIDKAYWHDAEFSYWSLDPANDQMDHVRNKRLGVSYADVRVNKLQALALEWPQFLSNDQIFVSMQMAAQDVYTRAKANDHWWYYIAKSRVEDEFFGQDAEDRLLNTVAGMMAGKVSVYGKPPLAAAREKIEQAGERNSVFTRRATRFHFLLFDKTVWTDLEITLADLNEILSWLDRDDALKGNTQL